jgi:hypothetical protein
MKSNRVLFKFFTIFFLVFALFFFLWPAVKKIYPKTYCYCLNAVFKVVTTDGIVTIFQVSDSDNDDIRMVMYNQKKVKPDGNVNAIEVYHSIRQLGYLPSIFLLSLVFSSALSFRSSLWNVFYAMILVHFYILLKVTLILLYNLIQNESLVIVTFNPFWKSLWIFFYDLFISKVYPDFFICILIWISLLLRKNKYLKGYLKVIHHE